LRCDGEQLLDLLVCRRQGGRGPLFQRHADLEEHLLQPGGGDRDEHLRRAVALVLEGVRRPDRHVGERPRRGDGSLAVDRGRDLAFEDVEALLLPAVDVRGRPPPGETTASNRAYFPPVSSPVARKRYASPTTARASAAVRNVGGGMVRPF